MVRFNQVQKIILFGGSPLLVATVKWLKTTSFNFLIYTSPRHSLEVLDDTGLTLRTALDQLEVKFIVTENINTESQLMGEITQETLGLGMGEAWSFSEAIINKFEGRLFDFMGIPHPRYRGGAHYTWMIMRGDKRGGCNIQIINKDMVQGVFDSGEIIKKAIYYFPEMARTPLDYFNFAVNKEVCFIQEFLQEVMDGVELNLSPIDESQSLYLPRLNTVHQAWIDWSWLGDAIELYICAFDDPYPGASTYFDNMRVHLKACFFDRSEMPFHAFQSGLITRINPDKTVVIATQSGHLHVGKVLGDNGQDLSEMLYLGGRFYTPHDKIEYSQTYKAEYGA